MDLTKKVLLIDRLNQQIVKDICQEIDGSIVNVDAVCIQEINEEWAAHIQRRLGYKWSGSHSEEMMTAVFINIDLNQLMDPPDTAGSTIKIFPEATGEETKKRWRSWMQVFVLLARHHHRLMP